ncbi:hypothetical protein BT63DRAFT_68214 [Microthyrium microscopicum]|uniref:BZIP domain-containing protein n=1 Tax=Microthyrium microscopicum TaxID=703497 RepID=A0A6A6U2A1_9PEZI|nr:hypothetical protein BT63DRAFT_68214 [Microthyrium microscopicum]
MDSKPVVSVHNLKMESVDNHSFVKLNDIENSQSMSTLSFEALSQATSSPSNTSAPNFNMDLSKQSESKSPQKKRKTWGQKLPEPTTCLPPRKRAKTEAEKEQRRIERVKRNRQAAHNSRERKRVEHEKLIDEKNLFLQECRRLQAQLEHAQQQIRDLGQEPTELNLDYIPGITGNLDNIKFEQSEYALEGYPPVDTPAQSNQSSHNTPSLSNTASPSEGSLPYTPSVVAQDIELTQQSAALLCSLGPQCRSISWLDLANLLLQQWTLWMRLTSATTSTAMCPTLPSSRTTISSSIRSIPPIISRPSPILLS